MFLNFKLRAVAGVVIIALMAGNVLLWNWRAQETKRADDAEAAQELLFTDAQVKAAINGAVVADRNKRQAALTHKLNQLKEVKGDACFNTVPLPADALSVLRN